MKKILTSSQILAYIFLCILFCQTVYGQKGNKPKWIEYDYRESMFSKSTYVMGFTSELKKKEDAVKDVTDRLKSEARVQLIESIFVTIKSIVTSNVTNENTNTASYFRQTSMSMSKLNLSGLTEEQYFDEKDNAVYAIAYAKKADISKLYRTTIADKKSGIEQKIKDAANYTNVGDNQQALKELFECYPEFREIEEAQSLIVAFESLSENAAGLYVKEVSALKTQVNTEIKKLQKNKQNTLEDICFFMAHGLKLQVDKMEKQVRLLNFTFQDSRVASAFSKRLSSTFEQKLISEGIQVSTQPNTVTNGNKTKDDSYMLSGTYWEDSTNIKLIGILRDDNGKAIASVETFMPMQWIKSNNVSYKPDNLTEVINNSATFSKDIVTNEGGLVVDITTNKGNENPVFTKGDTLVMYVKANKECYLRVIYHFADGKQVLFFDNYHISNSQANQIIEIPGKFECSEPFGVEILQMNAQSEEFKPLHTYTESGNTFIQDDLNKVLANTRGFKPIGNKGLKAEKLVTVTTIGE